jgi:hypothetical protein
MSLLLLLLLISLFTASGYVPRGSGTTIPKKAQSNTYTLKKIHNTKITNTITKLQTQCTQIKHSAHYKHNIIHVKSNVFGNFTKKKRKVFIKQTTV